MVEPEPSSAGASEPVREAVTMALYVCIVLIAEFVALGQEIESERAAVAVIWGTTVGLALAHVFAFNLAARLFAAGAVGEESRKAAWAQLASAFAVSALVTIPFAVLSLEAGLDVAAFLATGIVGLTAYLASRNAGAGRSRALVEGAVVLLVGAVLVGIKASLGH